MPVNYDKRQYRRRNRIEIMFGRLEDWRRVATLRQMPDRLLFRSLPHRYRHVLAMSPEPRMSSWINPCPLYTT